MGVDGFEVSFGSWFGLSLIDVVEDGFFWDIIVMVYGNVLLGFVVEGRFLALYFPLNLPLFFCYYFFSVLFFGVILTQI